MNNVSEIVVTGSRIQRPDIDNPIPTMVITDQALKQQGYNNLADILTDLPQFSPAFGASRTQSTLSAPAASGLNLVNLRNLGTQRALVLINGRRVPSGTITTTAADLSTLPAANIARVEVITGGASSTYGADAVSGVINIITRSDFEGLELGLQYGAALEHGDNKTPAGYVMIGHRLGDKGYASAILQYDYQGLVSCRNRTLCADDFAWFPPAAPVSGPAARSAIGLGGRFFISAVNSYTQRNGSYTDAQGALIPFVTAVDGFNRNATRDLAIPTKRILFASQANYQVTDAVNVFTELNYGSSQTRSAFEGEPWQSSSALDKLGSVEVTIPTSNPFVPAALAAAANSAGITQITWWKRLNSLGLRGADNLRETVRAVAGVNGDLDTLFGVGSNWRWEASYTYGRTTLDDITEGLVDKTHLYAGLRVEPDPGKPGSFRCTDPVARSQGCIPINPFALNFSAADAAYLTVAAGVRGRNTLEDAQAYVTGSLLKLPAGDLKVAAGLEQRHTNAFLDYDDVINRGIVAGNRVNDNPETTLHTNEAYVEAVVPVLRDMSFAKDLSFEGAYRRSWPARGADYDTWKYGGDWSPLSGIRFRVLKARSVRAPDFSELSGGATTAGLVGDPCTAARRTANATRTANCATDGVPAGYTPPLSVEQGVTGFVGANPNVAPEVGDTITFGLVLTPASTDFAPAWLRPLVVSVDRFQIDLQGAISTLGRQTVANLCYDTAGAGRQAFCSQLTRGADPSVPGATYVLRTVDDRELNVGRYQVNGVDLAASYDLALGDLFGSDYGQVSLSTSWTLYDKALETTPTAKFDLLGYAGGSISDQGWIKTQGRFMAGYNYRRFTGSWTARYVGEAKQAQFQVAGTPNIPSFLYHDVQGRFEVTDQVQVYGGVTNLLDKKPPMFATGNSGTSGLDTIPGYYDVFGRSAYVGVKLRF